MVKKFLRETFCKKFLSNSLQKLSVLPEKTPIVRGFSQELKVFERGLGETFLQKVSPRILFFNSLLEVFKGLVKGNLGPLFHDIIKLPVIRGEEGKVSPGIKGEPEPVFFLEFLEPFFV